MRISKVVEGFIDIASEVLGLQVFSNVHVEFCNLVSIHTWSRNFDGTRPVEIEVT